MGFDITPVNRNLHTRATFLSLEFEDLFLVLIVAAVMNVLSHFVSGELGGVPLGVWLQYGVPLAVVPVLMAFKYGRPRGYMRDLVAWHTQPRRYCALAGDRKLISSYIREDEPCR